jgi:3-oxoacyl-[acyl-carrier protein] reductase
VADYAALIRPTVGCHLFEHAALGADAVKERALSFELVPHGITVNCVAPGRINTVQILERLHPTEASRQAFIRDNIPAGHFGEPEELAAIVAFLASPLADYISGAHIPVDGGALRIAV